MHSPGMCHRLIQNSAENLVSKRSIQLSCVSMRRSACNKEIIFLNFWFGLGAFRDCFLVAVDGVIGFGVKQDTISGLHCLSIGLIDFVTGL